MKYSTKNINQIKTLRAQGYTYTQIAKQMNKLSPEYAWHTSDIGNYYRGKYATGKIGRPVGYRKPAASMSVTATATAPMITAEAVKLSQLRDIHNSNMSFATKQSLINQLLA